MRAIVLAAGEGRRLRPLTKCLPKALLPLGSRPMIEHALEPLRPLRDLFARVEFAVNRRDAHAIEEWAHARLNAPCAVYDVDRGHGDAWNLRGERASRPVRDLLTALELGRGDDSPASQAAIVAVCDNVWREAPWRDMAVLAAEAIEHGGNGVLAVVGYVHDYSPDEGARLGCVEVSGGCVARFDEKPGAQVSYPANVFFCPMILTRDGIGHAAKFVDCETIGEFVGWLAQAGEVRAVEFFARPEDVGTIESYQAARERIEREEILEERRAAVEEAKEKP